MTTYKTRQMLFVILIVGWALIAGISLAMATCNNTNGEKLPVEFQYNSHDYIYFPNKGVVHSPDCKHCQLTFD